MIRRAPLADVPLTLREKREQKAQRELARAEQARIRAAIELERTQAIARKLRREAEERERARLREARETTRYIRAQELGFQRRRSVDWETDVQRLGERIGPRAAIENAQRFVNQPNAKARVGAARAIGAHPDDWAEPFADAFDVAVADIYDVFFGYDARYGTL